VAPALAAPLAALPIAVGAALPAVPGEEAGRVAMGIGVLEPLPLPAAELAAFWVEVELETLFCAAALVAAPSGAGENA